MRNLWKYVRICIAFILVVGLLGACIVKPSVILEDTSCKPPCWKNIHPGISTPDVVMEILQEMETIPSELAIKNSGSIQGTQCVSWSFKSGTRESGGWIYFLDNTVSLIKFDVGGSISLGELVSHLGKPDELLVVSGWADSKWLSIILLYPTLGVSIKHFDSFYRSDKSIVEISEDIPVSDLYYFDPKRYDRLLYSTYLIGYYADEITIKESIQPWRGFGEVQLFELPDE